MPAHDRSHPAIVITGIGLVSPLGHSAWQTFAALLAGRTLADRAAALPADIQPLDLVRALGCVSVAQHTAADPSVTLAEMAAREALFMADAAGQPVPALLGASKGAVHALTMASAMHLHPSVGGPRSCPNPVDAQAALTMGPHGYLANHLSNRLGLGPMRCTVAACASSLTALHQARLELLHAHADQPASAPTRMLVVTSEAALLPMFVHSYQRLGVLPPLQPQSYRGRPLDAQRRGFMLAELGAAVVLERADSVRPGQIELLDSAIAAESFDLIRPAPGMPALHRVAQHLLADRQIDLLQPHATGTVDNDSAELAVYADLLAGKAAPDIYAHKGALGHGLGASGLVSVVLAWLCARTDRRPPMPWLIDPIASALPLVWGPQSAGDGDAGQKPDGHRRPLRTHAVFAAGFGGHVAGAVIRRV